MAAMPFPCNGLLLCCVNLPYCFSINLLVVLSLISIFLIGDGLALALNSFGWFTHIVSQVVYDKKRLLWAHDHHKIFQTYIMSSKRKKKKRKKESTITDTYEPYKLFKNVISCNVIIACFTITSDYSTIISNEISWKK